MRKHVIRDAQAGAAISVKVTPNADRDEVAGAMADGSIKIRLKAKPVEGAANAALVALLADRLGVPASKIEIVAGLTNSRKLVSILGLSPAEVEARLLPERAGNNRPAKT